MKRIAYPAAGMMAAALALTGCNDDLFVPEVEEPETSVAGVYIGALAGDPGGATDFETIVLESGAFWTLYGVAAMDSFTVQGFARGAGVAVDGTFTSTSGTDFGFIPPAVLSLEAGYGSASFAGSYTTSAGTTDFTGGPFDVADYDFQTAASLAAVEGAWDVEDFNGIIYTLDVAADGSFDLAEQGGGCTGSGQFTASAGGINLFDVSLTYDNVVECDNAGGTASGIGIEYTITTALTDQLLVAVNDDTTFGMALFGTRPSP